VDEREVVGRLRASGCVFAEEEARLLVDSATSDDDLTASVRRRERGEPLEQILGWADFAGLRISVAPGVFVPRRRSELLAREATRLTPAGGVVVELCCGTGAVGLAVARSKRVVLHAVDVDPRAVDCARTNLLPVGAAVYPGDLYAPLPDALLGRVDVVVANAPYVPTGDIAFMPAEARDHEPAAALDGGPDGLTLHRRIAAGACEWLTPRGRLLIETSERQATGTAAAMEAAGMRPVVLRDDDLDATVVIGTP
jgi:release factor glutamine methyltransferase